MDIAVSAAEVGVLLTILAYLWRCNSGVGAGLQEVAKRLPDTTTLTETVATWERRIAALETLPATWEDIRGKIHASEQRTRVAIRKAQEDGLDVYPGPSILAPGADAEGQGPQGVLPLPGEDDSGPAVPEPQQDDIGMRVFLSKLGR